jgi:hypothetical protein
MSVLQVLVILSWIGLDVWVVYHADVASSSGSASGLGASPSASGGGGDGKFGGWILSGNKNGRKEAFKLPMWKLIRGEYAQLGHQNNNSKANRRNLNRFGRGLGEGDMEVVELDQNDERKLYDSGNYDYSHSHTQNYSYNNIPRSPRNDDAALGDKYEREQGASPRPEQQGFDRYQYEHEYEYKDQRVSSPSSSPNPNLNLTPRAEYNATPTSPTPSTPTPAPAAPAPTARAKSIYAYSNGGNNGQFNPFVESRYEVNDLDGEDGGVEAGAFENPFEKGQRRGQDGGYQTRV